MDEQSDNPYAAPKSNWSGHRDGVDRFRAEKVRVGQRLAIYAILVQIVGVIAQIAIHPIFSLLLLVALVMSLIGVSQLGRHLYGSVGYSILFVILMFVPLVNLLTLLAVNGKATKYLRSAGYKVGFLGAGKPSGI